jgi:DNA-binding Lrp family transcriptional regulator
METGYIFFTLKPGTKKDFLTRIKDVQSIKDVRLVIGTFDAIARIEAENIEGLEKVFFNEIDNVEGIISCRLHIVAHPKVRK